MTNMNHLIERPRFFIRTYANGAEIIEAFRTLNPTDAAIVETYLIVTSAYSPTWIETCLLNWINENVA